MSSRGQRRGPFNSEPGVEAGNEKSSEFNVDDAPSDSNNIKWTSTPSKRLGPDRLRRRLSTPAGFDSEESTDVMSSARPLPRRRSAKSLKTERRSGLKRIESADRRGKRRGKSKRRRSEGHEDDPARGNGSTPADRRESGNRGSEKRRRDSNSARRLQEGDYAELPIAELLRKAQENHKNPRQLEIKYEEPMQLQELTTNTVYVQGRNGFSAVKIGRYRESARSENERLSKPIHVAIRMYNLSRSVMFFCQGLLGGIALSQIVLEAKVRTDSDVSEQINGTDYSRIMSGVFLFLNTVCLLSAMDRTDLAHLDLEHLREITCHRCMLLVTLPLYMATICIHLTDIGDGNLAQREIHNWKFSLCIAAWICVALGPTDDMMATHLETMRKYAT